MNGAPPMLRISDETSEENPVGAKSVNATVNKTMPPERIEKENWFIMETPFLENYRFLPAGFLVVGQIVEISN
jgi:hypothetical protein